jgi:(p)ppGpp synthase/HD superfamily hydrolase
MTSPVIDPARFAEAVEYAAEAHASQFRKRAPGDDRPRIPYISHLLAVSGMVIEDLGDTDEAIAGLLHDVIEDQNDDGHRPADIEARFGSRVLVIVKGCSAPKKEDPGMADFRTRKEAYLAHLRDPADPGSIRVSLCDKVHNARSTVNDLETDGPQMWDRFNAGAADQLWWYTSLAREFAVHAAAGRADAARVSELTRLVQRMQELTAVGV